jgi:DNA polymerase I
MLRIRDSLAGKPITLHYAQSKLDLVEVRDFISGHRSLAMDTESTGINCYRPGWELRTVQYGNSEDSYVVPARHSGTIAWAFRQPINWIGHNGPHDVRSVDVHLGYETGVVCAGETYIPSHHADSRNRQEGGIGHGLKDIAVAKIDRNADKWEKALKEEFKKIMVLLPGEVYKSGVRKGQQKYRKAKLSEGWKLIDPLNPAYWAYAAVDPILTYLAYQYYQPTLFEFLDLYHFDHEVQIACDVLHRRAMLLDVPYTRRLGRAYQRKANQMRRVAEEIGDCQNIQSGDQVAASLQQLGVVLTQKTDKGKWKTDAGVLRSVLDDPYTSAKAREFVNAVLIAKQVDKRRTSYTESMLREMDEFNRVHPSINSLAARTTRMSVGSPPLQQLPTKDNEDDLFWMAEEEE